jgi:general secretion pathway protein L
MPDLLLLRLPAPGQQDTEWLRVGNAGEPASTRQRGPLTLAAAVGRSAKVIVIVPATQLLLAEPELPPGSGVRLKRAVPFALEEQLTEDVETLVFALGKRRSGGGTPVAVVARSVLEGWLAQLSTAGIEPTALYADMELLPQNPGQTVLWVEGARLSVRRPGKLPFSVELTPLTEALVIAGVIADPPGAVAPGAAAPGAVAPGAGTDPRVAENAILFATREDFARVQAEIERVRDQFASLNVQLLPDGPLPWLARGLAETDAVNLLQGEFSRTPDYSVRLNRWRIPAALAAVLLGVYMAGDYLELREARHRIAALDAEIAEVFAAAMPTAQLQDPRHQMQTRLDRIRHSGPGAQQFLRALEVLSGAVSATPDAHIDSLSYREDSLDLKVLAPSLEALSHLSQLVGKQGLNAEIQSSMPVATGVEAHLQVRTAAAKARS